MCANLLVEVAVDLVGAAGRGEEHVLAVEALVLTAGRASRVGGEGRRLQNSIDWAQQAFLGIEGQREGETD